MARTKRPASDTILALLKRGPKRGLTAAEIASRTELNINTTRTVLWSLHQAYEISITGFTEPERGRPAYRYVLAA